MDDLLLLCISELGMHRLITLQKWYVLVLHMFSKHPFTVEANSYLIN